MIENQIPEIGTDWGVHVSTGSRLSFTMLDLNGSRGRRNGVAAVYIDRPRLVAKLFPAQEIQFHNGALLSKDCLLAAASLLANLRSRLNGGGALVVLEEVIPEHSGFGSKTNTLLGLAKAYVALCSASIDTDQLARMASRGGTGGASVNLIDRGGFHIDGGHSNPDDFAVNVSNYLVPSRASISPGQPPSLTHLQFPPWPIVVVLPTGKGLSGTAEVEWFRSVTPIPAAEADRAVYLTGFLLAAAVAEHDYTALCTAIRELPESLSFKREQILSAPASVRRVLAEAPENGMDAIGMSSMGPMCYGFTRKTEAVSSWLEALKLEGIVDSFWFTNARNRGAELQMIPTSRFS